MEKLKTQTKRIISILLIITILVSIMPNFGLLKISRGADIQSGLILRLNRTKGVWYDDDEEYKAISFDILIKNMNFTSFVLPIKFDPEKLTPAYQYARRNKQYLDTARDAEEFTENMGDSLPSTFKVSIDQSADTDWSNVENGTMVLEFLDSRGTSYTATDEMLICTISFIVDDSITNIDQITNGMIDIDASADLFEIYDFENNIFYRDLGKYFSLQGIDMLPTVKELSVKIDPTKDQTYTHGDKISLENGLLTAKYTNDSEKDISMTDKDVTVKTGDIEGAFADIDHPQLTFEYEGQTVNLPITVIDPVEKISFYDKDNVLEMYPEFSDGDEIPVEELFIKTVRKSGKIGELALNDKKITLSNNQADIEDVDSPYYNATLKKYAGIQKIEITYKEDEKSTPLTTSFNIVVNDMIGSIEISDENQPEKTFKAGEIFTKSGAIKVIGFHSGVVLGEIAMTSDDVSVTEEDGSEVDLTKPTDNKTLTVTYANKTTNYNIKVENTVVDIKINMSESPLKVKYNKDITQEDLNGITVTEIMADGTTGDTKNLQLSWLDVTTFNKTSLDKQELVVNYPYDDGVIKGTILVKIKNELTSLRIANLKTEYEYKEELSFDDAEFYIGYLSGETGPYSFDENGFTISHSFNSEVLGPQYITFTYTDGVDTVTQQIEVTVVKATPEYTVPTDLAGYEGYELSSIDINKYTGFSWTDENEVLPLATVNNGIYETTMTFTPVDEEHYKVVENIPVKVTVKENAITGIEIQTQPTNTSYYEGDSFNPTGMEIKVKFAAGNSTVIKEKYEEAGVTFEPSGALTTDNKEITVNYKNHSATVKIDVQRKLVTKIEITEQPTDKEYIEGQQLDLTGMVVTATYNNGDERQLTAKEYTTNPLDGAELNEVGTQDITVTYTGNDAVEGLQTAKTSVTVAKKVVTKIEVTQPTKKEYVKGQKLDLTGMTVTATYNDGDEQEIGKDKYTTSPEDKTELNSVGTQTITVTYTGEDAGAELQPAQTSVTVVEKVVTKIAVTNDPTDMDYVEGETINKAGMIVTATYNDGTEVSTEKYEIIYVSGDALTKIGQETVTIKYTGTDFSGKAPTTTLTVNVKAKAIDKISIKKGPDKVDYIEGQDFDPTGMEIEVHYNDGETRTIKITDKNDTQDVTFNPSTNLQTTDTKVVVTYRNQTAEQKITVAKKVVTKIEVTKPSTNEYIQGQKLNLAGMTVTATYNDESTRTLSSSEYTTNPLDGAELNEVGTQTITVTYTGNDAAENLQTAKTEVTVIAKIVTEIKATQPSKHEYVVGQELNLDGMIVTATYNDGTSAQITNYTTEPEDGAKLNEVGTQTITITYTGTDIEVGSAKPTATTTVEVKSKVVTKIAVTNDPTDMDYVEGETINTAGMVVTATYNDGTEEEIENYEIIYVSGDTLTKIGQETVTIKYTGTDISGEAPTTTLTVNVKARAIDKISITKGPDKVDYIEGQDFDPTGMEIEVHYNDGETRTIKITDKNDTQDVTFNPSTNLQIDNTIITVTYREQTAKQQITVKADYIKDITVKAPSKTAYNYGDSIELSDAEITIIWASGVKNPETIAMTTDMLSNSDITNFESLDALGTKEITVKYGDIIKTNAFQITISDVISSIKIEYPNKLQTEYVYGDTINVKDKDTNENLYIIVKYVGGTPDEKVLLTDEMLSGFSMTELGQQTVIVTYEGQTDSYTINVKDEVIGIEITKEPARRVYKVNETVDFSDIEVRNVMKSGKEGTVLAAGEYTITGANTDSVGEKTVTVTKKGTNFTDTFKITVIDGTAGIKVSKRPKDVYNYGDSLDLSDGEIVIISKSGDEIPLSMTDSSVKVTEYDPYKLGDQELTVTYTYTEDGETKTQTTTFTVTVKDYWTGKIEITALPDKLTYKYGEEINLAGGKVAKVMASGAKEDEVEITGEMVSGYDKQKLGKQTITVTYEDATDTFDVTVVDELIGISMNTFPNKTEYTQGQDLDLTGATIKVTRLSGTEVIEVTKEMISGFDPNKVGTQVITVTYEEKTTSFAVTVKENQEIKPNDPTNPNQPSQPSNPSNPSTPTNPDTSETETYTVTFIDYDGAVLKVERVKKGSYATAPIVADRKGYKFLGWNRDFSVVEEDLTIQAQYEKIEKAEVNIPDGKLEVEKGKDLDLSDVTLTIRDEEGNVVEEIPVTEDMISGFNPDKVGTQTVTITYIDKNGVEHTATFTVKVTRPVETLGEKDEVNQDNVKDALIPAATGLGITGLLLLLISLFTKKNVEIYAVTNEERKLLEKQKISKNERTISIKEYQEENSDIEIVINSKIANKLDGENVEIVTKDGTETYKINAQENEDFVIKM